MTDEQPPPDLGPGRRAMPNDDIPRYRAAAEELKPPKVLARILEHNKFVISTISIVGTLLTGLGAVTASVAVDDATFVWKGIPVVPVGAFVTAILASIAVLVALVARRPNFDVLNSNDLFDVRDYIEGQIPPAKRALKLAWFFFITSAVLATLTAIAAGVLVLIDDEEPRNLASLTTSVGAEGAVTAELAGSVDGLDEDQVVRVALVSDAEPDDPILTTIVYPDEDGVAALKGSASVPVGGSSVTAYVDVLVDDADAVESYELVVEHPVVPKPTPATDPTEEPDKGDKDKDDN